MSNKEHTLFCVLGESASGKDSLVNRLCERMELSQIISFTTRERREGEGNTHIFVTEQDYEQMLTNGQVAVQTEINGYHYWTTVDQLYSKDIYIIDALGLKMLKETELPNIRIVSIYINVPTELRKARARERGDNMNTYISRSLSEKSQFRDMKKNMDVDYMIPNISFAKAYSIFKWIATVEGIGDGNMMEGK